MDVGERFGLRRILPKATHASLLLVVAAVLGVVVACVVAAFETITQESLFSTLLDLPIQAQFAGPALGLLIADILCRSAGRSSATADEYPRAYHQRDTILRLRDMPARLLAGATTIGLGGSLGLEGPAVYAGAVMGTEASRRLRGTLPPGTLRVLLTAGAAAGVAAVFKTPATGVLFALEVPYQNDIARRALMPALIASASSYLTFVAIVGAEPLIPRLGSPVDLSAEILAGAVILGIAAGLAGRGFSGLVMDAKRFARRWPARRRIAGAGLLLAALAAISYQVFDTPLTLGAGYDAIDWARDPSRPVELVAALLLLRIASTVVTVAGGGVGGLFIPLVVQGVLLGRCTGILLGHSDAGVFPIVGLAAFLGAGYRTPIAAVMFVAESSVGESFIIPALIAAAISQLFAGKSSVSSFQRSEREGHLERRLKLPISAALSTDVRTAPPDATVAELVHMHIVGNRERVVPVVDGTRYVGMCGLEQIGNVPAEAWNRTLVEAITDTTAPVGMPEWTLLDAIAAMDDAEVQVIAVTDLNSSFVGLVYESEIVKLEEILDETGA